jgi:hypothetical protein
MRRKGWNGMELKVSKGRGGGGGGGTIFVEIGLDLACKHMYICMLVHLHSYR